MHIITRKPFSDAVKKFPRHANAIAAAYKVLRNGDFRTPDELKQVFNSLDNFRYRNKWWVINLAGNNLRLIVFIDFKHGKVFVKYLVDHKTYDQICKQFRH